MFLDNQKQLPNDFNCIEKLIIDRKQLATQVVCLDLDKTLIYLSSKNNVTYHENYNFRKRWLNNGIDIKLDSIKSSDYEFVIVPRPGFAELITELRCHAVPVIYSSFSKDHVDRIMRALSAAYDIEDPEQLTELSRETTYACWRMPQWSREQCIQTDNGYEKSLGHFAKQNNIQINDLWLIDNRPDMVDFPSHVIQVPPFYGDPDDRALFTLIDDIFIN